MNRPGIGPLVLVLIAATVLALPTGGHARPQFAQLTGNPCSACHISPQGGGPLKPEGEKFRQQLNSLDIPVDPGLTVSTGRKLLHFALYLLHLPFGVAWVGLFLYAFGPGLRRGTLAVPPGPYLRQMIYSMAVVLATGPFLVATRMEMVPGLFSTRFGMLLVVKVAAAAALFIASASLLWHIMLALGRKYRRLLKSMEAGSETELTPDDLLLFSGRDKRKALVAVDGKVYDVTGRNLWRKGIHPGGHHAGHDLTEAFGAAPHGREVFDRVSPVGTLLSPRGPGRKAPMSWAVKLGVVASVVILLVVALWRW